ncbi:hypothetical protein GCM10009118_07460 [Wandonia haliotis]|uniref:Uncharacterized protein n=1 Tax=Wandonia haliotis TaxID=574963 RepID=A0ABN1MN58_9FLAO
MTKETKTRVEGVLSEQIKTLQKYHQDQHRKTGNSGVGESFQQQEEHRKSYELKPRTTPKPGGGK